MVDAAPDRLDRGAEISEGLDCLRVQVSRADEIEVGVEGSLPGDEGDSSAPGRSHDLTEGLQLEQAIRVDSLDSHFSSPPVPSSINAREFGSRRPAGRSSPPPGVPVGSCHNTHTRTFSKNAAVE